MGYGSFALDEAPPFSASVEEWERYVAYLSLRAEHDEAFLGDLKIARRTIEIKQNPDVHASLRRLADARGLTPEALLLQISERTGTSIFERYRSKYVSTGSDYENRFEV